mmetsp:Transcript_68087/g.142207  ORF Transcript_68087/g.142207 Transcript_68087/m.142207 type:complete len:383 (-) Transcript_68087:365-1513(-)|eukprot:CAMPEP_0206464058 /NCGR_PEP_ID=MMETSP0324_2-20121206/26986_1 /ASSEMBLY_ACC=CAM_ASM_000836 /TAXON_ID=2866 /ORGANISM="Crypthecodinium cohnii, Strain Seligo" /LENGTH=382 /DNA_ID=CAMNT_0053936609 /DNA_START=59 /DNA_END=1207 /DNA_ORIENTATION=+
MASQRVERISQHVLASQDQTNSLEPLATGSDAQAPQQRNYAAGQDVDLDNVAYGFMASQALFSGLELNIFDTIAKAGKAGASLQTIQAAAGISAPRLQTLLTALVSVKCLRRSAEGLYTNSPNTSQYMVSTSPAFYGDYLKFQIGRQFYHRMGALTEVMTTGQAPNYASWFSDPEVAQTYTQAQHNGSISTAKYLVKKKLSLEGVKDMLDVGGGSGAFSYVFAGSVPGLKSTVLELPEVCRTGEKIKAQQSPDVQSRVKFVELDATSPKWPVPETAFDVVLMSYLSGSVPESIIVDLYTNALKALRPGGRLLIHDFMVDDSLDGPALGALWALQHVTVNADGLGLRPKEIIDRLGKAGFDTAKCETKEMIHGMTKLVVAKKN